MLGLIDSNFSIGINGLGHVNGSAVRTSCEFRKKLADELEIVTTWMINDYHLLVLQMQRLRTRNNYCLSSTGRWRAPLQAVS